MKAIRYTPICFILLILMSGCFSPRYFPALTYTPTPPIFSFSSQDSIKWRYILAVDGGREAINNIDTDELYRGHLIAVRNRKNIISNVGVFGYKGNYRTVVEGETIDKEYTFYGG